MSTEGKELCHETTDFPVAVATPKSASTWTGWSGPGPDSANVSLEFDPADEASKTWIAVAGPAPRQLNGSRVWTPGNADPLWAAVPVVVTLQFGGEGRQGTSPNSARVRNKIGVGVNDRVRNKNKLLFVYGGPWLWWLSDIAASSLWSQERHRLLIIIKRMPRAGA